MDQRALNTGSKNERRSRWKKTSSHSHAGSAETIERSRYNSERKVKLGSQATNKAKNRRDWPNHVRKNWKRYSSRWNSEDCTDKAPWKVALNDLRNDISQTLSIIAADIDVIKGNCSNF